MLVLTSNQPSILNAHPPPPPIHQFSSYNKPGLKPKSRSPSLPSSSSSKISSPLGGGKLVEVFLPTLLFALPTVFLSSSSPSRETADRRREGPRLLLDKPRRAAACPSLDDRLLSREIEVGRSSASSGDDSESLLERRSRTKPREIATISRKNHPLHTILGLNESLPAFLKLNAVIAYSIKKTVVSPSHSSTNGNRSDAKPSIVILLLRMDTT